MVDQIWRWSVLLNSKMNMVINNTSQKMLSWTNEGQEYAVLVHVQDEDADHEGQDDTYMILARIETNEEGVEEYVPLDEEDENFETLVKLYEDMDEDE